MAVLSVALFVLVAYIVIVGRDPGPTPGDSTAIDLVEHLHSGWLTEVSRRSSPRLAPAGSPGGWRRSARRCSRPAGAGPSSASCVVAMTDLYIGVQEIKDAVDRPRPPDPLVACCGSSFPSGHAAYSVLYVWLGLTAAVRLRPGMARRHRADHRRHRDGGRGRALPRLSRRPLPQRRQRAAGRWAWPRSPPAAIVALVVTHRAPQSRDSDLLG